MSAKTRFTLALAVILLTGCDTESLRTGLSSLRLNTSRQTTDVEPESGQAAPAPVSSQWVLTPVIANPEKYYGNQLRIYGTFGRSEIAGGTKKFVFQELRNANSTGDGLRDFRNAGTAGPEITMFCDKWYAAKSSTAEGREMIRNLARFSSTPATPMGPRYFFTCTVRQYANTFEAYLDLNDITPAQ